MFESMMAVMEESERRWESVADFERSVEARFKHIKENGRTKLNGHSKRGVPSTDKVASNPHIDGTVGMEGIKQANDAAACGFISMLEDLKEYRNHQNYGHRDRKQGVPGFSHPYDPDFFAARPVTRGDYKDDDNAMGAYWKEWKNLELKNVWRWETLTEWDTVSSAARLPEKKSTWVSFSD